MQKIRPHYLALFAVAGFLLYAFTKTMETVYTHPTNYLASPKGNISPAWIYEMHSWTRVEPPDRWSQASQDLYLERIFEIIGSTNKYFVEFGFDGNTYTTGLGSNTGKLHANGWRGLLLDSTHENKDINLHKHKIYSNNIAQIFRSNNVPRELDYLSCDIDSHDLWIMRAILKAGYRPRVMTVEFNINYPISAALTSMDPTILNNGSLPSEYKYQWQDCAFGASPKALEIVANSFGYVMIGRIAQVDLLFMRRDLIHDWWLVPEMEWFFRNADFPLLHGPLSNKATLDQIVDYDVFLKTSDFRLSHASARQILKDLNLECFRPLHNEL